MRDDLQRELHRLEATLAAADAPKTRVIDELSNMRQELSCETDPSAPFKLANVRIAAPCKERWADMTGDERVRVCNGCDRPVFNLSEMTRAQAEAVLATRGITPCVRFYRRTDGTVMTTDCPPGARRSRRLAVVAAGTALLGSSTAMAEPPAPAADSTSAPASEPAMPAEDSPATAQPTDTELTDQQLEALVNRDDQWTMGIIVEIARPAHAPVEWSTWVRGGYGVASRAPEVVARGIATLPPERATVGEGGLGADVSFSLARHGDVRLGAWGELRTSSGTVLGGELIVAGLPPHPYISSFDGGGSLVLRAGANEHVVTTALGFGYVGSWTRTDPWVSWARHVVGVRVVASVNRSLDDARDWSVTVGVELDPIGAAGYLVHRVLGD